MQIELNQFIMLKRERFFLERPTVEEVGARRGLGRFEES